MSSKISILSAIKKINPLNYDMLYASEIYSNNNIDLKYKIENVENNFSIISCYLNMSDENLLIYNYNVSKNRLHIYKDMNVEPLISAVKDDINKIMNVIIFKNDIESKL